MDNAQAMFYLGRIISWLDSVIAAGGLNDLPEAKEAINRISERSRLKNSEDMPYLLGASISWLESITATKGLAMDAKEKTENLLMEVRRFQKTMFDRGAVQ